jgi:hypothetical protein
MPNFKVLYSKAPTFVGSDPPVTIEQLHETHVFIREVQAPTLDAVFFSCKPSGGLRAVRRRVLSANWA